ncbi:MAG TPA: PQQ-binding-like beta-propeller repeat protein [Gemmataceae bacterium]|nr:PQQ-binding-like beta-propeller repeat protein [Gemmataceae bacterium]
MTIRISLAPVLLTAAVATAGDWPQFRGPNGSGVSDETRLPTTWGPKDNVKWKADVPGRSAASPVVYGNRVYVTAASGPLMDRLHALCLDAETGKVLWHRQMTATGNTACHPKSSMAAPTPCVNADGVYCLYATADLAAFDHDGNLKWYRSLVTDYPDISNQVGMGSSPILWKDFLLVPMDTVGDSFLAAIDTKYGKNVWKVDRPKDTNWVTPTLRQTSDRAEIVFATAKDTVAYNAADGKKLWTNPGAAMVPTAITVDDTLIMPGKGGMVRYQPDGAKELWKSAKLSTGYTTPIVYKDRVYALRGVTLTCADLQTGKEVWPEPERVTQGKGQMWASPVAGDGKVYTFDDTGLCKVFAAGDQPKVLATNDMKEEILGTPAIAHGSLYIQTVKAVYCIKGK